MEKYKGVALLLSSCIEDHVIVPCHRVVAADGALGGFTGGLEVKRWLLGLEGVTIPKERGRLRRAGA